MNFLAFLIVLSNIFLISTVKISETNKISIMVLNDIHYDPDYNGSYGPDTDCRTPNDPLYKFTDNYSSYGKYGCDPSQKLIEIMLDEAQKRNPNPDVILLPGDFVSHGFSQDPSGSISNQTYTKLLDIIYNSSLMVMKKFPNSIVLPAIGNNDPEFHYEVPNLQEKYSYYDFLYDLWFQGQHLPNNGLNLKGIQETFSKGGYYRVDINDKLSILSINTLYYSKKNDPNNDPQTAIDQIDWLKDILESIKNNEPDRKVILTYHILPGYKYNEDGSGERLWDDGYCTQFDKILSDYEDQITGVIAAHTHLNGIRALNGDNKISNILKKFRNNNLNTTSTHYGGTIITPSISPVSYSNPGITVIDVEIKTTRYIIKNLSYLYINLDKLINDPNSEKITYFTPFFFEIDYNQEFQMIDYSPSNLFQLTKNFDNDENLFKKYLVYSLGYPQEDPYFKQGLRIFSAMGLFKDNTTFEFDKSEKKQFICILTTITQSDYKDCKN